jgi:integrase
MPRTVERLSPAKIAKAKIPAGKNHAMLADGGNLWLRIGPTGAKSWVFRFRLNGHSQEMGLGSLNTLSIVEARARARQHRQELLDKVNPLTARTARHAEQLAKEVRSLSFEECARKVIATKLHAWSDPKHPRQWAQSLEDYAFPVIGKLPVDRVETGHITRILEPIWNAKRVTASRLRGRIEAVLDYATVHGWRSGENPARWKGHLQHALAGNGKKAEVEHHAALPWREMHPFVTELERQEGMAALALRFAILTAGRAGEILGAQWSEIDVQTATWTVPGGRTGRMKEGLAHRVPLSEAALRVLREAARQAPPGARFVFPGARGGMLAPTCMRRLLKSLGRGDLTVHGFRSAFRDWASDTKQHDAAVERALAHKVPGAVRGAYERTDLFELRVPLMAAWARHCCTRPAAEGEKVVEMRRNG